MSDGGHAIFQSAVSGHSPTTTETENIGPRLRAASNRVDSEIPSLFLTRQKSATVSNQEDAAPKSPASDYSPVQESSGYPSFDGDYDFIGLRPRKRTRLTQPTHAEDDLAVIQQAISAEQYNRSDIQTSIEQSMTPPPHISAASRTITDAYTIRDTRSTPDIVTKASTRADSEITARSQATATTSDVSTSLEVDTATIKQESSNSGTQNRSIQYLRVTVRFMNKQSTTIRNVSFAKCATARDFYTQACIADTASKDTRLLTIIVGGVARKIVPDDDDLYQEMVLCPVQRLLAKEEGERVDVLVKHYM